MKDLTLKLSTTNECVFKIMEKVKQTRNVTTMADDEIDLKIKRDLPVSRSLIWIL